MFTLSGFVKNPRLRGVLLMFGLFLGYWIGFTFTHQMLISVFPPTDSSLWWLFFLPVFAGLAIWKGSHSLLFVALLLISAIYSYLLSFPLRSYAWSLSYSIVFCCLAASLLSGLPLLFSKGSKETPATLPVVLAMTSVASALLFLVGSSAVLNQQVLFLVSMQIIPSVLFVKKPEAFAPFCIFSAWFLINLWVNAWLFTELSGWGMLTLLGLLSPWVTRLPFLKSRSGLFRFTTTICCCLIILMLSVGAVLLTQTHAEIYY